MSYLDQPQMSTRKMVAIVLMVLLHALLGYAFITGLAGTTVTPAERTLLREREPWGVILFKRNIETPAQVRRLTASIRDAVGREAPVLVDCADDDTYLIDVDAVEAAVTPRTAAIIPVHLYGQAAPVERLLPLARRTGARIVEDAAQSQGARRNGTSAGALGDVAATSFYPGKNLGAYGDAGAALTGLPSARAPGA